MSSFPDIDNMSQKYSFIDAEHYDDKPIEFFGKTELLSYGSDNIRWLRGSFNHQSHVEHPEVRYLGVEPQLVEKITQDSLKPMTRHRGKVNAIATDGYLTA